MSPAQAQSERDFQAAVVEYAQLCGWLTYHTHDSRRSNPGFPDLVLVRGRSLIFAELKSARGRVTSDQQTWLTALAAVAGEMHDTATADGEPFAFAPIRVRIWRPRDWPEIESMLGRRRERTT